MLCKRQAEMTVYVRLLQTQHFIYYTHKETSKYIRSFIMRTTLGLLLYLFMISILVVSIPPQSAYARRTYVDQIATGAQHTCKILAVQRTVFCWGDNTYG